MTPPPADRAGPGRQPARPAGRDLAPRVHRLRRPGPGDPARAVGPADRPRRMDGQGQRRAHRTPRGRPRRCARGDRRGPAGTAPDRPDEPLHRAGRPGASRPRHGRPGRRDRAGPWPRATPSSGQPCRSTGRPRPRAPPAACPGAIRPCSATDPSTCGCTTRTYAVRSAARAATTARPPRTSSRPSGRSLPMVVGKRVAPAAGDVIRVAVPDAELRWTVGVGDDGRATRPRRGERAHRADRGGHAEPPRTSWCSPVADDPQRPRDR